MRLSSIVPAFVVLAAAGSAFGAIEEFTGYSGSLWGNSGGSSSGGVAWTSAWGDTSSNTMGTNAVSIGSVNTETSTSAVADYGLGNPSFESTRGFTALSGVSDIYVWALVRINHFNTNNSYGGIGIFRGGTELFLLGELYQSGTWGAGSSNLNGSNANSSSSIQSGTTALLCMHIDQVTNTLEAWVNPNFAGVAGTPDLSFNYGGGNDDMDTIRLRGGNPNNGNNWQFDNLNIQRGSPFAVPTPGAAALLGLGTLAAARRRRA